MKTLCDSNGQQRRQSPLKPTTVLKDHFKTNREVIIPAGQTQNFGLLLSQEKIPTLLQHQQYSQKETDDISICEGSAVTKLSPSKGPRFDKTFYSRKGSVKDSTENLSKDQYSYNLKGTRLMTESMQHLFRNQPSTLFFGEENNVLTTDDLLKAAIVKTKTRQDKNKFTTYESTQTTGQPSQTVGVLNANKRMHLTTNLAKITSKTAKKNNVGLFLEGTNSQTTLPQVSDISYDLNYSQGHFSQRKHSQSKVQVSNIDMQSYLANGTITKEFIQSNKKELEVFIKNQVRSGSTNEMFKGYKEISGLTKEQAQALGIHTQVGVVRGEENRFTPGKRTLSFAQSDLEVTSAMEQKLRKVGISETRPDQKPEKGFKTSETVISNRVIEMWLNETLTDAERMDIPQVLLKPENKKPIIRYGIERFTLSKAGLSHDQIDRVYRSLFVYSVGFFELLKNLFAASSQNYEIVVSLWKVFHVLLEYCCKTDYNVMITEITQAYAKEKSTMEANFNNKIEAYVENERVLKQNMDTMQTFQDKLEREKVNERQLRLKLEEEYMQNSKNHEEEVQLRLKFEQKLNELHREKRKLQIKYDRCVQELDDALQSQFTLEKLSRDQSNQLIDLKQRDLDQKLLIQTQKEKIESLQTDLTQKNQIVVAHYKSMADSKERVGLVEYELSDARKYLIEAELKINTIQKANFDLNSVNSDLKKKTQDLQNELDLRAKEFETWKKPFFEQQSELAKAQAGFIKSQEIATYQREQVNFLRVESQSLSKEVAAFKAREETQLIQIGFLTQDLKKRTTELENNMTRLHLINNERHHYKRRFREKREKNKNLKRDLAHAKKTQLNAEETINQLYKNTAMLTAEIQKLSENTRKLERNFIEKLTRFEEDNLKLKTTQKEFQKKSMNYADMCELLKIQITSFEDQIAVAHEARRNAEVKLHEVQMFAEKCEAEMLEEKQKADRFKVQAVESGIEAEEARQITNQFQSTVRLVSEQINEQQAAHRTQLQSLQNQVKWLNSMSQMEIEDFRSRASAIVSENANYKMLIARSNNIQQTVKQLEFYQRQSEILGKKAKDSQILLEQTTLSFKDKLSKTEEQYKKLLEDESLRHRLEVNDLESEMALRGAKSSQAAQKYAQEISDLKKDNRLLDLTLRKGGNSKILAKRNTIETFVEKSTQTKGNNLPKILPIFDVSQGQNRRSLTPDAFAKNSSLKTPITEEQLNQLKDWKEKINNYTVQIKKTANLQTFLVTKYVAHLDELRRHDVEIPVEVRRNQLVLFESDEFSQSDVKKKSKKSSNFKENDLESLLSKKSDSEKSKIKSLLQNVGHGESSDDFLKKARQAAINQGLDEAEIERFLGTLARGDDDSYDSEESSNNVGSYQPNGNQKIEPSPHKKKVYGKQKDTTKKARFADPKKTQEQNDSDRYEAFKEWILQQEMGIMEKMQEEYQLETVGTDEEKVQQQLRLSNKYKTLREKVLSYIPYEFKVLKLSEVQKHEIAAISKQQAEDFMLNIELENELAYEEQQIALESARKDGELVTIDSQRVGKKIINFQQILDFQSNEYINILNSLLQVKREFLKSKARHAQKTHYEKEDIAHIQGKRENVFLIPMAIELSYTLYHQSLLKKGMQEAAQEFFDRPGVLKRLQEERQLFEDQKHKLWLERHKQKLARIEIVREDLKVKKDLLLLQKLEEQSRQIQEKIFKQEIVLNQGKNNTDTLGQLDLELCDVLDEVDVTEQDGGFFVTGKTFENSDLIQDEMETQEVETRPNDGGYLGKVIEGGVAAQNKAAFEAKKREEKEQRLRQSEIKRRVDQKEENLQRDESGEKVKSKKLGPSSIRTLIRAADSRMN